MHRRHDNPHCDVQIGWPTYASLMSYSDERSPARLYKRWLATICRRQRAVWPTVRDRYRDCKTGRLPKTVCIISVVRRGAIHHTADSLSSSSFMTGRAERSTAPDPKQIAAGRATMASHVRRDLRPVRWNEVRWRKITIRSTNLAVHSAPLQTNCSS